jgi:hypothetical protein
VAVSIRGLLVALLCGLIGLGGGAVVAYAVQPKAADAGQATPLPAYSPSLPVDPPVTPSYAPDIDYPTLSSDLSMPTKHQIHNDLATWQYHVPFGWTAYGVCQTAPCPFATDEVVPDPKVNKQNQVRFRPSDEPVVGGYSLRVKILTNTDLNTTQMVGTKVIGFRQAYSNQDFSIIRRTPSAVYFTYVDGGDHLRYDFFQWFAAPGHANATLEMSVSGRKRDQAGLEALFNRFADNLTAQ